MIPKPKKPKSLSSYKKKLDKFYSLYIRLKDCDQNCFTACVTCGKKDTYKKMQNGHFISRIHLATRFEDENCHPQCYRCNVMLHGNMIEYYPFMLRRYSQEKIDELRALSKQSVKFTREWYEKKIAFYKGMVERWIGEVE